MSYKLEKPYTKTQRLDFIVEYNHNQGLLIDETETALYALEPNEIMQGEEPVINPDYEAQKVQEERERLNMLSLTKREVFLALYKDKGITPEQLRAQITDEEALIEFDFANDYYRGNPLTDKIGIMLGYSTEDLDHLFETGSLPEKPNSSGEVEETEPIEGDNALFELEEIEEIKE